MGGTIEEKIKEYEANYRQQVEAQQQEMQRRKQQEPNFWDAITDGTKKWVGAIFGAGGPFVIGAVVVIALIGAGVLTGGLAIGLVIGGVLLGAVGVGAVGFIVGHGLDTKDKELQRKT